VHECLDCTHMKFNIKFNYQFCWSDQKAYMFLIKHFYNVFCSNIVVIVRLRLELT